MAQNQPPDQSAEVHVAFFPADRQVAVKQGSSLLAAARSAGIDLEFACNGNGTCGKCKVRLVSGAVTAMSPEERRLLSASEIESGYRLACVTYLLGDVVVGVAQNIDHSSMRIEADGFTADFVIDPPFKKRVFDLQPPSLEDHRPDLERLSAAIGRTVGVERHLQGLRNLSTLLRAADFTVTAVFKDGELIGVEAGDTQTECYGIALDIGTTTIVLSLIALDSGAELATASAANAQGQYGQDVISRIQFAGQANGLELLQVAIVRQINQLIAAVCQKAGIKREHIYELVAAGNTTMLHLLLGVSPATLANAPYVAVFLEGITLAAQEIGVEIAPFGLVYTLPSVSSYVGGDIVAGMIATGLHHADHPVLLVDIGTNGEIVFGSRQGLVACSCAAGPALEGMNISCGTIAVAGAVEKVTLGATVEFQTIGAKPPVGICGSGIIDMVAELLRSNISDRSGRLKTREKYLAAGGPERLAERIKNDGQLRFELTTPEASSGTDSVVKNVYISQKDIRQVQLAKAAIASAIEVLIKEVGTTPEAIGAVYVAGAFGKHLRRENLLRTGFIPQELGERIEFVGNTSKTGAAMCLLSKTLRREAEEIARQTRYFELSVYPGYDNLFFSAITFPNDETDREKKGE